MSHGEFPIVSKPNSRSTFPSLHDAEVIRVEFSSEGSTGAEARFHIKTVSEETLELVARGIEACQILHFAYQNVIFECTTLNCQSEQDIALSTIFDTRGLNVPELQSGYASGQLEVLQISSSVGCEMAVLCEEISLSTSM
ncbi:MAG TPA: hypothetical protein PLZ57_07685 [Pseudobdellovibrionaceae bacterium]|nr:hypothetical protein [Pseudobdellovibrionaceae bacterium]